MTYSMKAIFPSRSILLLIGIGFIDLVSTAWLYHAGLIMERNPLMAVLLNQGEWLFIAVKTATLVTAWIVLAKYAKHNLKFVRQSCWIGSAAYALLWSSWFLAR